MKVLLSNSVENVLARGEISCFEQFLLLSRCFKDLSAAVVSESVCMWEIVNNTSKGSLLQGYLISCIF